MMQHLALGPEQHMFLEALMQSPFVVAITVISAVVLMGLAAIGGLDA